MLEPIEVMTLVRWFLIVPLLLMAACADKPAPVPAAERPAPVVAPVRATDESARFPVKDRVDVQLVEDHLLNKGLLPGGNLATYQSRGKTYQLFLVKTKSSEAAAMLLFDFKGTLGTFKFVPSFGGYYGMDGAQPVFIFQKGTYLAGIMGLSEKEADAVARDFAARL
jgi:hypothetical protein